eukprot:g1107.t1
MRSAVPKERSVDISHHWRPGSAGRGPSGPAGRQRQKGKAKPISPPDQSMSLALQMSEFEGRLQRAVQQAKLMAFSDAAPRVRKWMEVKRWAERAEVSLRFTAEERCSFLREETREVEDASRSVTEFSVGYAMGLTSKTVTKETQFFWNFEVTYKVELLRGVGAEASDRLLLQSHSQSTELKNKTKVSPRPAANVPAHCESVRITELLKLLEEHDGGYLESLSRRDAFTSSANLSAETIFVPALPLFADAEDVDLQEVQESGPLCLCNETDRDGPVISVADGNRLLKEEMRTWLAKKESLAEEVQDRGVFTPGAAFLLVGLLHCLEGTLSIEEKGGAGPLCSICSSSRTPSRAPRSFRPSVKTGLAPADASARFLGGADDRLGHGSFEPSVATNIAGAAERFRTMSSCVFSGSPAEQLASLKDLQSLAVTPELASLLIHEDTLGVATKITGKQSVHFTNEVMAEASLLVMTLLSHNFHLSCEHPKFGAPSDSQGRGK